MTARVLATAEDTRAFGEALGAALRPGDLVILTGGLGAGKTTLTQGLAAGLGVRGPITSPTFVIARVHPSLVDGPALVHVDAYRLAGLDELDDLDLDTSLDEVQWLLHADGQGSQGDKQGTWTALRRDLPEGVWLGWKNFEHEDAPMLTVEQTMERVDPRPSFISYQ